MILQHELVLAREALLKQTAAYFTSRPGVLGIVVAGSLPAGTADAYSDIDLRIVATPEEQLRLVAGRLEAPSHWGDLLFNEWLEGTTHCVSHFRPFLKIDVFYINVQDFQPSPWLKLPAQIILDRTGVIRDVIERSRQLGFPLPTDREVSRILSKALASAHEVVRRAKRGELFFAHTLLNELRSYMVRIDGWIHGFQPDVPADLKWDRRLSQELQRAFENSYVGLDASAIEAAVVALSDMLGKQIPELHKAFALERSLALDVDAIELVKARQIA